MGRRRDKQMGKGTRQMDKKRKNRSNTNGQIDKWAKGQWKEQTEDKP
jgi:hypothetical protein